MGVFKTGDTVFPLAGCATCGVGGRESLLAVVAAMQWNGMEWNDFMYRWRRISLE